MSIEFNDNTMSVIEELKSSISSFLKEAGGELQAQIVRNSRTDTGQTKGSYEYQVEEGESESTVYIGSNYENAIWEEFGTGEYAINGDGRKTPWVYYNKKDGKFYRTTGKTANRPMYRAYTSLGSKLTARLETILKGG